MKKGLTLIELIVVIICGSILIAVASKIWINSAVINNTRSQERQDFRTALNVTLRLEYLLDTMQVLSCENGLINGKSSELLSDMGIADSVQLYFECLFLSNSTLIPWDADSVGEGLIKYHGRKDKAPFSGAILKVF